MNEKIRYHCCIANLHADRGGNSPPAQYRCLQTLAAVSLPSLRPAGNNLSVPETIGSNPRYNAVAFRGTFAEDFETEG
jgi:hypothetical protein